MREMVTHESAQTRTYTHTLAHARTHTRRTHVLFYGRSTEFTLHEGVAPV